MNELELISGMTEWRQQHPKATLREMEVELDARMAQLRAKMLEDMVATSRAVDWAAGDAPRCSGCGQSMVKAGATMRQLTTHGGRALKLKRQYARCPACGAGFFPLDQELGLLPGKSPLLYESLVRLSAWLPFGEAVKTLHALVGVQASAASARRATEGAGAAYVALQEAAVATLEHKTPRAPAGPDQVVLSTDGAMVPLLHGQ